MFTRDEDTTHVSIEYTKKEYKADLIKAWLFIIASGIMIFIAVQNDINWLFGVGMVTGFIGLMIKWATHVAIWWDHG